MHTLITIRFSHYCEKARWGLDLAGVPYEERARLPFFHLLETIPQRGRSTPMLLCPDGRTIKDSSDILAYLAPKFPDPAFMQPGDAQTKELCARICALCNGDLGKYLRASAYAILLTERELARPYIAKQGDGIEKHIFPFIAPLWEHAMSRVFPSGKEPFEKFSSRFWTTLDALQELRGDHPYMCGESWCVADLTMASLLAHAIAPDEFAFQVMPLEEMTQPWQELVQRCRAHPIGELALRVYREHR